MNWKLLSFITSLLVITGFSSSRIQQLNESIFIVNVSVIPMDSERILHNQNVHIQNGFIQSIGPAHSIEIPEDAARIDGTGKFLVPGLIDMHTHQGEAEFPLFVANGVTSVRIMSGNPRFLELREEIKTGTLLGPALYVAGPIINGPPDEMTGGLAAGGWIVRTYEEGAEAVRNQVNAGYDFIKVYNLVPKEAYEGIVSEAAGFGIPVTGHIPFEVGLEDAFAAGHHINEHLRGYIFSLVPENSPVQPGADMRTRAISWIYADISRFKDLAEKTKTAGMWNVPTLTVNMRNLSPAGDLIAYFDETEAKFMSPGQRNRIMNRFRIPYLTNFSDDDYEMAKNGFEVNFAFVRSLRDAGAGILAGSDVPVAGFSLQAELMNLSEAGLTNYEVLSAATSNAARAMGKTDRGIIAAGKRADLVLLDGNPLSDLSVLAMPAGVVLAGEWLSRSDLDSMLSDRLNSFQTIISIAGSDNPTEMRSFIHGESPKLSPDGSVLFYQDLNWTVKRSIIEIEIPDSQNRLAVTGGIGTYNFSENKREIIVENKSNSRPLQGYDLSPDGNTIVYTTFISGNSPGIEIRLIDVNSKEIKVKSKLEGVYDNIYPQWSPDGNYIAFTADDGLYTMSVDAGKLNKLSERPVWDREIVWSPDSKSIAAGSYPDDQAWNDINIFTVSGDSDRSIKLYIDSGSDYTWNGGIAWHPDGTFIAYSCYCGQGEMRLASTDGSSNEKIEMPEGFRQWWTGSWSPDGEKFFFLAYGNPDGLYEMDMSSKSVRFVAPANSIPVWSRDGSKMAWTVPYIPD